MQTFISNREQIHSNLIGLHGQAGITADRLSSYGHLFGGRLSDPLHTSAASTELLTAAVSVFAPHHPATAKAG
ncbi:hypothetical protein ACRQ5Q_41530 (plasmid) [Bradyrhizobium sp. PMVTL-01]|uniref:hypothetical protein n=1 Tax=Bradyrhizobium sp. PMVTL-01 TaxID=3434999 RepID=UPI003F6F7B1F